VRSTPSIAKTTDTTIGFDDELIGVMPRIAQMLGGQSEAFASFLKELASIYILSRHHLTY